MKFDASYGNWWFNIGTQETATCPYPEPDEFNPRPPILFLPDIKALMVTHLLATEKRTDVPVSIQYWLPAIKISSSAVWSNAFEPESQMTDSTQPRNGKNIFCCLILYTFLGNESWNKCIKIVYLNKTIYAYTRNVIIYASMISVVFVYLIVCLLNL